MDHDFVCRNCGSSDISSVEEGSTWATIDISGNLEDGLEHDWPFGVGGDVEWETKGFICEACYWQTHTLEELVVPQEKFIDPARIAYALGNL